MNQKKKICISLLAIACLYVLCRLPSLRFVIRERDLRPQQEKLAKELGIRIDDYPFQSEFPAGYFATVLHEGMTLAQVHRIVRGYQDVFRCYGDTEVYYFFDRENKKGVVFMIRYDPSSKFVELRGSNPFEPTISLGDDCTEGRLDNLDY
jgi:hypothetical protein